MENEILFLTLTLAVSIYSGIFGFGGALILIPFSTFFLPVKEAVALLTIYFIATNSSRIFFFRKDVDWKTTLLILIGNIPMVYIGANLMVSASTEVLEIILGIIILAYILNDLFKLTKELKVHNFGIVAAGGLYGFFSGIIGTGSAIKAALLTHMGLRKETFIATMAATALFSNIIKITVYSKSGLLASANIQITLALILIAILGTYTGRHLVKKVNSRLFKKIIIAMLTLIALKLIFF